MTDPLPTTVDPALPDFDTPDLARAVERLPPEAVDRLDFGAIRLDVEGRVALYSARERQLSGVKSRPVENLAFFTEVAPCMNTPMVKGRIDRDRAAGTLDAEFSHIGDFADRDRELRIRAQSAADGGVWLFLTRP